MGNALKPSAESNPSTLSCSGSCPANCFQWPDNYDDAKNFDEWSNLCRRQWAKAHEHGAFEVSKLVGSSNS